MTDNDVIKALECCSGELNFCSVCPYYLQNNDNDYCREDMNKDALDLINRQKAEIEQFADIGKLYSEIKAEAIKEFAERLKTNLDISVCGYSTEEVVSDVEDTIDNLVKVMTEGAE